MKQLYQNQCKTIHTHKHIRALSLALSIGLAVMQVEAHAGASIKVGDEGSLSLGFGMRSSFSSVGKEAPDGSRSKNFSLDSARLYVGGSLNKNIKGMFNSEKSGAGDTFQVIDAAGIFEISPELSIWTGRFLSPSDRANMAGPYYSLGGGYWANIASRYGWNGGIIGRDEGVAVVGSAFDGMLGYSVGAFEGDKLGIGSVANTTVGDSLMYATRLQFDFWDAEPGYYGTGNYLGAKDILAVAFAGRMKTDGATTLTTKGDYASYSVDFLMEKKLGDAGAASLEAAYYNYDTSDIILSEQGTAFSAGAGYLIGKLQPFVRYQKFDADTNVTTKKSDLGALYIIDGYNAQVSATYSSTKTTALASVNGLVVALQLQF